MVSSISLNAYSYSRFLGSYSKLYVPVEPSAVIYSQFNHISGVAASSNQNGIPVSKIRILNTLIDQLTTMRTKPQLKTDTSSLSDEQAEVLIKKYQEQIQSAVNSAHMTGYGLAGAEPQAGALFALSV